MYIDPDKTFQEAASVVSLLDKWTTARAAIADRRLSASAKMLFVVLLHYRNARTGRCDPSVARLAEEIGLSDRQVRALICELERLGWVRVTRHPGARSSYSLTFREAGTPEEDFQGSAEENFRGTPEAEFRGVRKFSSGDPGSGVPPNKGREQGKRTREEETGETLSPLSSGPAAGIHPVQPSSGPNGKNFGDFWRQYPRKDDPKAARRAYERAVQEGAEPSEIFAGVLRYAAERDAEVSRDPAASRYTKTAARWLEAGAWANEPAPPHPPAGAGRPQSIFELVMQRPEVRARFSIDRED